MGKRPLTPGDVGRFKAVGDPQVSPDGQWVLWVLQTPDTQSDANRTDIWLGRADGAGAGRPLTTSGKDRHPRWSPDGSTISFVSERSGKAQIWLINVSGGEAWRLPSDVAVATPANWSRNGKRLTFGARVFSQPDDWVPYPGAPDGDRTRAVAQAEQAGAKTQPNGVKTSDVTVTTRLKYRFDGTGYYGDRRSQVFVIDVAGPADAVPVAKQVTSGDFDHQDATWTDDGKLICVAVRRPDADLRDGMDMWLVDPADCSLQLLYEGDGPVQAPAVSPDGSVVAFLGHDCYQSRSTTIQLFVLPLAAARQKPLGQPDAVSLTAPADRPAGNTISSDVRYITPTPQPCWSEDGKTIYYTLSDQGHSRIVALCVPPIIASGGFAKATAGQPATVLGGPGRVIASMSCARGQLAYVAETGDMPCTLFGSAVAHPANEVQLSHANDELLADIALSTVKAFTYKGADGWPIDAFLMLPPNAGPGPHPTVLFIHGGPHGVYGETFQFQCQIHAAAGFAVLFTNPRGSQNYGQDFAKACVNDWGGKDYEDIMAGVDHLIATGVADPDRLGITGWSYGGYMTTWTITQTNRFKAAVAGAIIYNRHNFWGTSDIGYNFGGWQCGGTPWDNERNLLSRSGIRYVANVETPVLLLHGEADLRCPIEQAEQFFATLRYLGRTAVMVRYPGEYHGFTKPSHRQDRFARSVAWFKHYLK